MKIAIIDSGVQIPCNDMIHFKYKHFYIENGQIYDDCEVRDYLGHGTAITNIIIDGIANLDVKPEIHIIKIFENELKTNHLLLIEALKYCLELKVNIINISLGIMKRNKDIERLCNELKNSNSVIIATHNQKYYNVYPACYDSVISITSPQNSDIINQGEYIYIDDENLKYNILAYGGKTRLKWLNNEQIILDGVSFACPKVIVDIINNNGGNELTFDIALEILKSKSKLLIKYENLFRKSNISGITACFPLNKEVHSILRFNKDYNIKCILDFKGRGIIGETCSKHIENISYSNIINEIDIFNVEDKENDNNFDNILIGDISILQELYSGKIYKCLKRWQDSGKKMYSFMPYENLYPDIKIEAPSIIDKKIFDEKYLRYSSIPSSLLNLTPIVSILGTSKNQGKFTLQMRLKQYFKINNIEAALLSTEHQGVLLDNEGSFPYGAGKYSLINLPLENFYILYDYLLFNLSLKKCDIIITGLQSGIVTELHKYRRHVVHNLCLLSVMMPEVSVVVINSTDTEKIIEKNICRIKSFTRRNLACIVVYDSFKLDKNNLEKLCNKIKNRYDITCCGIDDIESIYASIVNTLKQG